MKPVSHNAIHVCTLVVFASLSLLTAAGSEEFPSVEKAMVGFSTNTVAAQERAYQYVLEKSRTMNGQNSKTVLKALKTMAEALKRGAEFDEICLAGMASDDERMRFACASALLQSPTLATAPSNLVSRVERLLNTPDALSAAHWSEIFSARCYALADIAVRRKNAHAAGELLLDVIRKVDPVPTGIAKRLLDANVDETTLDAAVTV